jgi:hypothetical protein
MFVIKRGLIAVVVLVGAPALALVLSGCSNPIREQETKQSTEQMGMRQELTENQGRFQSEGKGFEEGRGGGAPAGMTAACEGKSEGDGCSATFSGGPDNEERTVNGTCQEMRNGGSLSCMPEGRPVGSERGSGRSVGFGGGL